MPAFQASPQNLNIQQAVPGLPTYLLGSLNRNTEATRMNVTTVALSGGTATIGVVVKAGLLPVVGQLVSISGAIPSYFNATNAKITAVSFTDVPEDGIGTIQFALVNSNIGTTNSPGIALAPQVETGETFAALTTAGADFSSIPVSLQSNTGPENGRSIRADVSFPNQVGSCIVDIQTAEVSPWLDASFTTLGTVVTLTGGSIISGGSIIFNGIVANFARLKVRSIVGAGASIVGKIII